MRAYSRSHPSPYRSGSSSDPSARSVYPSFDWLVVRISRKNLRSRLFGNQHPHHPSQDLIVTPRDPSDLIPTSEHPPNLSLFLHSCPLPTSNHPYPVPHLYRSVNDVNLERPPSFDPLLVILIKTPDLYIAPDVKLDLLIQNSTNAKHTPNSIPYIIIICMFLFLEHEFRVHI